jgi:hypothetical protein
MAWNCIEEHPILWPFDFGGDVAEQSVSDRKDFILLGTEFSQIVILGEWEHGRTVYLLSYNSTIWVRITVEQSLNFVNFCKKLGYVRSEIIMTSLELSHCDQIYDLLYRNYLCTENDVKTCGFLFHYILRPPAKVIISAACILYCQINNASFAFIKDRSEGQEIIRCKCS